jgi:uncharacterized membrane protein (UPF0127 family)
MRAGWVLREGRVLAAADIADSLWDRSRGLVGRNGFEGALIVTPPHPVHTVATRFSLDVAFLDQDLRVVDVVRLSPWRLARPRPRCRAALQAPAGWFERWGLVVGDFLEVCEVDSGPAGGPPLFPPP